MRFIRSGRLIGTYVREVPVGVDILERMVRIRSRHTNYRYRRSAERVVVSGSSHKVDAVCIETGSLGLILEPIGVDGWKSIREHYKGRGVWLIEVKKRLNAEQLGQLLINRDLFMQDNREYFTIRGLYALCEEGNVLLEPIFRKYGITVYVV